MNKSCRKQRATKYTTRNSPPFLANQCQKNERQRWHLLLSKPDKRGIFVGKKLPKPKKFKPVIMAMAKKYMS